MKALTQKRHWWRSCWMGGCLVSVALGMLVTRSYGQVASAPVTQPAIGNSSADASIELFVTQLGQGLNLITAFGFIGGCVMVVGGFLNARRDENWKLTIIHGLGVAGSVALLKALFGLFVGTAVTAGFINRF